MTATTQQQSTGEPRVLATYECDEGERQLIGQRVDGIVRITDQRPGGRTYLVEQGLTKMGELEGLLADYLDTAKRLGYTPMQGWF